MSWNLLDAESNENNAEPSEPKANSTQLTGNGDVISKELTIQHSSDNVFLLETYTRKKVRLHPYEFAAIIVAELFTSTSTWFLQWLESEFYHQAMLFSYLFLCFVWVFCSLRLTQWNLYLFAKRWLNPDLLLIKAVSVLIGYVILTHQAPGVWSKIFPAFYAVQLLCLTGNTRCLVAYFHWNKVYLWTYKVCRLFAVFFYMIYGLTSANNVPSVDIASYLVMLTYTLEFHIEMYALVLNVRVEKDVL